MASAAQPAPTRTVVLLRPAERKRLEKFAAAESVSSGEIMRRSLNSYKRASAEEDELAANLLAVLNASLDTMLVSLHAANQRVSENLARIETIKRGHNPDAPSKRRKKS